MKYCGRQLTNRTIATLLAVFTTALLLTTSHDMGLTWDEPAYIAASESYAAWLGELVAHQKYALSAEGIQTYWEPNHEHPPLDKIWSGVVWSAARLLFDDLTAHRLGNILLVGALVALLFLMIARELGRLAGLAAVGSLITMPRFFFHAHLAALDVPAAVAIFAVVFLFWRTRDRRAIRWDIYLGLAWGAALATKINAIFVPPMLLLWILISRRRFFLFRRLAIAGLIGIPLSLILWPWIYYSSLARAIEYARFVTIDHWEIGQWYLGRFYMPPPWHFPFVMAIAVVPLTWAVLGALGVVRAIKSRQTRAFGILLALGVVVPMLPLSITRSMVYDNERHFMPAFPYVAALAGLGFAWVTRGLRKLSVDRARPALAKVIPWAVAAVALAPHTVAAWSLYPHLLSYYSETIGGVPGAARLQLETTYWCETYAEALPYLNAHAQRGDVIWVQNWSHDVLFYYQLHGIFRQDLRIGWPEHAVSVFAREGVQGHLASIEEADYVVLQRRQSGFTPRVRDWLRGREPVYRLSHQGVPLLDVYAR